MLSDNNVTQDSAKKLHMSIDGHRVTISFATEHNSDVSSIIRNMLLDDYIRRNGIVKAEQSA